jgi:hypothetical protein
MNSKPRWARSIFATLFSLALLLASAVALQPVNDAIVILPGEYYGLWHAEEAKFTIESVAIGNHFVGRVKLLDGTYKDAEFGFTGVLKEDNSLVFERHEEDGVQISKAGPPQLVWSHYVWKGVTLGSGTPAPPFEFRVWTNERAPMRSSDR